MVYQVVLLSNVGFYLGKMLAENKNTTAVIGTLMALATKRVRDTGRQLAGSECAERLLELFFSDEVRGAKELLVLLCEGSTDMRDRMGEARAIQRVVESADNSAPNCKLVAAFAQIGTKYLLQEAWGRAALRESGALDFLISRLASTPSNSNDRLAIVQPLRHFVHDTNGMAFLARNRVFVDTVVKDVTEFIAEYKVVCEPETISDEDEFRSDSPLLMEIESTLQKKSDFVEDGDSRDSRLHKDYSSLWAYSTPSPNRSSFSSPMYSPLSSGAGSPVSASSSSPFASPFSRQRTASESTSEVPDLDSSLGNSEARQKRTTRCGSGLAEKWWIHIIESELWLLTWQAQEDANLPYLCRDDVVNAVLSYLALAPSPDYRIGRVLRRLACSRPSIDSLLSMQFHTRVLHTLCMAPCRVVRYAKRCGRCERAAEFGREILRDRFRLGRISSGSLPALDLLFESLHSLLVRDDFLEICDESTYSDGVGFIFILNYIYFLYLIKVNSYTTAFQPPLCAQIVGAISTLVAPQRLREVLDIDSPVRPRERGECIVEKCEDTQMEMLTFENQDGELLAHVPMDAVCESSQYFKGMFTSDLQEKSTKRRIFVFSAEEEQCCAEDFIRFLHHISGCRAQCSSIQSAQTCVALIKLSDRYLCSSLSEYVSSPHGPARRLLNGETLPDFLPGVLTAQTHERLVAMCLLTLIRYCSSSQIIAALRPVSQSSLLVDLLTEHMKAMTSV
ncbi:hypothetical protein NECAME_01596 [Necator americanus]|uniref:BTB domain-containing protein n=1 Tax=Necator americanus TaxID=51031 RepID=W2TRT0_NECAM|nr:hypothetical protein NECAME_01596 [Necator americanus]ETN84374.1 hypothetical protein NECAME_01596 [Necator americanus]